ncbi:MAG TPA: hypothetical protein DDZ76_07405 [Xanthomonadales bacterium]|nr:hypothetical protein [Xanthomonadales bacterium]
MKFALTMVRLESVFALLMVIAISIYNYQSIDWLDYLLMIAVVDAIGYLPGRLWCIVRKTTTPPKIFYQAYNVTHSLIFALAVSAWYWHQVDQNLAFLGLFLHQLVDRGILGNFAKQIGDPYHVSTFNLAAGTGSR